MSFEIIPNLHPTAVHFPIALTLTAFCFLLAARIGGEARATQWAAIGHWTLRLAALTAVVAAIFGGQAFNSVDHDEAGHVAMLLHRNWALPTAAALAVVGIWDVLRYRALQVPDGVLLLACALLAGAVAATAWLGGELVYRHGIGVRAHPGNVAHEHDHQATPGAPQQHQHDHERGGAQPHHERAAGHVGHDHR